MPNNENKSGNKLLDCLEASPVRYLAVAVVVAAGIVTVVNDYTPLTFDESLLENAGAKTVEVGEALDPAEIETEGEEEEEDVDLSGARFAAPEGGYKDGVYRGTGYGYKSYITVEVTIKDGKIVTVRIVSEGDDPAWMSRAKSLLPKVVAAQSTNVDTVSGATYSSKGILEAISNALRQAAADGGKSTDADTKKKKTKKKKSKAKSGLSDDVKLADGVYIGYDRCTEEGEFDYYLVVEVTVKNGKVTKVANVHGSGTGNAGSANLGTYDTVNDPYLDWAANGRSMGSASYKGVVNQIMADAKKGTITSSIDVVSGATYSSKSILQAYFDALKKSAAAAGSKIDTPTQPAQTDPEPSTPAVDNDPDANVDWTGAVADGTYTAYAFCEDGANPDLWFPYYIGVTIQVTDGKVSSVVNAWGDTEGVVNPSYIYSAGQNATYLNRAISGTGMGSRKRPGVVDQLNSAIAAGKTAAKVDAISGATYSSISVADAFLAAVQKAKAAAPAEPEPEPAQEVAS